MVERPDPPLANVDPRDLSTYRRLARETALAYDVDADLLAEEWPALFRGQSLGGVVAGELGGAAYERLRHAGDVLSDRMEGLSALRRLRAGAHGFGVEELASLQADILDVARRRLSEGALAWLDESELDAGVCQNCHLVWDVLELDFAPNLEERADPDAVLTDPPGECPACGVLAIPVSGPSTAELLGLLGSGVFDPQSGLRESVADGLDLASHAAALLQATPTHLRPRVLALLAPRGRSV